MPDPTNPIGAAVAQPVEANPQANIVVVPEAGQQQNDQFIPRPRTRSRSTEELVMRDVKTALLGIGSGLAMFLLLTKTSIATPFFALLGPAGIGIAAALLLFGIFLAANSATNYIEAGSSMATGHRSPGEALSEANNRTVQGFIDIANPFQNPSAFESVNRLYENLPSPNFSNSNFLLLESGMSLIVPSEQHQT